MSIFNNNYLKCKFIPKHPEKCLNYNGKMGVTNVPQLRSSWEKIFANWCDLNENILEWGSEIIEIPYISCEDGKQHRYISDFVFTCKNRQGRIEKWLIEVKPKSQIPQLNENGQIIFPELNKKKKLTAKRIESWQEVCNVLKKNHDKWQQAREWARKYGYKFKVVSEEELGLVYQPKNK